MESDKKYTLSMQVYSNVEGLPGAYATAKIESNDGSISKSRAWIDKEFPTKETIGDFFHELFDEFVPRKTAEEPAKTVVKRGKKNG